METNVPIRITAHDQLCIERVPKRPCGIVIFGASGDLAHRKLLPSLFNLYRQKLLPSNFFILGAGRKEWGDSEFRAQVASSLNQASKRDPGTVDEFCKLVSYSSCDYENRESFQALKKILKDLGVKYGTGSQAIFYLAIPPELFHPTIENLTSSGLLYADDAPLPATQLVVEKPFGYDLASAKSLSQHALAALNEKQVYRIDHYLGKETVQNILMLRFANSIFEAVWNQRFIDHVQITAAETLGVEHRAGYYETAGVLRDMFQNHMLELLSLVAMEPPLRFDPKNYRDEKVKVLESIRPLPAKQAEKFFVRGQYGRGMIEDRELPAYREEKGVSPSSNTETFAAIKLFVDNWRWSGVPFYLRSGKRLAARETEIIIQFKPIAHSIFSAITPDQIPPNKLRIRIQPDEGIEISFNAKHPGPKMCMATLGLEFNYSSVFHEKDLTAYERLILDCMHGDPTLFVRQDMVEVSWSFVEGLLGNLKQENAPKLLSYPSGSWGPKEANDLIRQDGRIWGL